MLSFGLCVFDAIRIEEKPSLHWFRVNVVNDTVNVYVKVLSIPIPVKLNYSEPQPDALEHQRPEMSVIIVTHNAQLSGNQSVQVHPELFVPHGNNL